jgi:hypothetical protein
VNTKKTVQERILLAEYVSGGPLFAFTILDNGFEALKTSGLYSNIETTSLSDSLGIYYDSREFLLGLYKNYISLKKEIAVTLVYENLNPSEKRVDEYGRILKKVINNKHLIDEAVPLNLVLNYATEIKYYSNAFEIVGRQFLTQNRLLRQKIQKEIVKLTN